MTTKQRIAFFKLVSDAWGVSGFGGDKDAWRKGEMAEAVPGCEGGFPFLKPMQNRGFMSTFPQTAVRFSSPHKTPVFRAFSASFGLFRPSSNRSLNFEGNKKFLVPHTGSFSVRIQTEKHTCATLAVTSNQ